MRKRKLAELSKYTERARGLLMSFNSWENVIFGYSSYLTDGHFLPSTFRKRDPTYQQRDPDKCLREQTLVLKFIVTNYRTEVEGGAGRMLSLEGLLWREANLDGNDDRRTELLCAESHYADTCDYIVHGVSERGLPGEEEVWSQEWLTVLNRLKLRRKRDPVVLTDDDRSRFPNNQSVLCAVDYCRRIPLKSREPLKK